MALHPLVDAVVEAVRFAEEKTEIHPHGFAPNFTWIWGYVTKMYEEPVDPNELMAAIAVLTQTGKLKVDQKQSVTYSTYRFPYPDEANEAKNYGGFITVLMPPVKE